LADGKKDWALWNVDMALSMQPRLAEAVQLKERLTNQAYWADEPRHSAAKYVIQRMIMTELGKDYTTVVPARKPRDGKNLDKDVRDAMGIIPLIETPLEGASSQKVGDSTPKDSAAEPAKSAPRADKTNAKGG
jgi:hypothetical protein